MALALVVGVAGSAPRPLGAKLIITADGDMAGSVSGGCVEAAVAQEAQSVIATGTPRLVDYGIADELAQSVGLTCGGIIQVLVMPLTQPLAAALLRAHQEQRKLTLTIDLNAAALGNLALWSDDGWHTGLDLPSLPDAHSERLRPALHQQRTQRLDLPAVADESGPQAYLLDALAPAPRLIIVGAVHIAAPLVTLANTIGFRTLVVDARRAFATPARFGHATAIHIGWPADILPTLALDRQTFVVTLTHDDKLDLPALAYALSTPARYVGALGSKRTLPARQAALRALGVTPAQLARLHAPVGLDLGGRRPEEIALAILAEIVVVRNTPIPPADTPPISAHPHTASAPR
jgi:xanthine dehydrogenase accessory factor